MIKNTAGQKVGAQMVSASDGSAFTGSVTVAVTVDAGTQATGSVGSGACVHEGNGYHTYAPAQAETNGDLIAFTFTGTGAVPQTVQVYTRAATPDVNVSTITNGAITAAAIATGAIDADAIADNAIDAGAIANDAITAAKIANGAIDAASFAADVDAEILSYLVDDATRIDASALNTASGAIGSNGSGLTEAGGDGDHLTAINLPNQTMDIVGNITGNLSGSVGSVTGNVGGNVTGSIGSLATQAKADVNAEADQALADVGVTSTVTGRIDAAVSTRASQTSVDDLPTNAELATALAAADDAVLAAIAALNNLSAAQVNAEVDQAIVDASLATAAALSTAQTAITAIKAKTDSLTFTQAGHVDANLQYINDVALVGDGDATPWGPA